MNRKFVPVLFAQVLFLLFAIYAFGKALASGATWKLLAGSAGLLVATLFLILTLRAFAKSKRIPG